MKPEDEMDKAVVAVLTILSEASKTGQKTGEMPCPLCGTRLQWWRVSGRAAGGKCETLNCIEFRS